jgi:protein-S-isoprenylcysteine O-methyltransferase Ste14
MNQAVSCHRDVVIIRDRGEQGLNKENILKAQSPSPLTILIAVIGIACVSYISLKASPDVVVATAGVIISMFLLSVSWASRALRNQKGAADQSDK